MQSGGLFGTCSFIWLWSSVKARGHTSWELMTCIPREFSLLKSAVHFELLVFLLLLLLAQFLVYKQSCNFRLFILQIFLSFFICLCCAFWAACVAAVLAACSIYALQTITKKFQVEACVNNQKNQVFGGAINWDMSLIMSCLYCCYFCCLLSSCFTNFFEFSFFLFCMFTFSLSISSITFEPVINVCPKGNWLFLHGLFLVLRFLKLGKFSTSNFKVFITLYCDCSVLLCRLIH